MVGTLYSRFYFLKTIGLANAGLGGKRVKDGF